ncbi:DNA polymerase epsilon catalytic subunit A [Histomonas meleagridis]|uniref:DNA polymerase epsilon catalytic subunit A n=1 Tax=Histomonas meleagridis TaxID=135588 RepID=UPI0035595C66|nr:DNA polymerase epsilon catalytic subunit A [Histomonas meleagridis]KAH0800688.1 DNA polymerase epsilon catalytic subunit A [Histomonas meleagridis]
MSNPQYLWYNLAEDFDVKNGWLINVQPTKVQLSNSEIQFSAVDLFFMEEDGSCWRVQKIYEPYFYVLSPFPQLAQYEDNPRVRRIENVNKIDGEKGEVLGHRLRFANVDDLKKVRDELNREKNLQLREYDVPYYERFCLDFDIRVGLWYNVRNINGEIVLERDNEKQAPPQPRILAFDIECSKEPLMFPNPETDQIMMISYMVDGKGYLVTNKNWFSKDIESFEYSPLEYYCEFTVWNCDDEQSMLNRWLEHIKEVKPHIFVTFNGDAFDWPFVERRMQINGISMYEEIGFHHTNDKTVEYLSHYSPHLDCFKWVKRDSYLPAGSHGLKAVTKAKLQYNPLELDPEDICPLGVEDPQRLANYSVSDAYATYYLYIKYVHPFIFSLTTVLPVNSDDCLRRGTGTLCEALLMASAYHANIFFPNKSGVNSMSKWNGHILHSESYSGGRVEALRSGIYRDDIETDFDLDPEQYQNIINRVPSILDFVLDHDLKLKKEDIENFDEVQQNIITELENIRDHPRFNGKPIIIHLDVGAMYPNIILTNRLQPTAIVNESICSKCQFKGDKCQRKMTWTWRGEFFPATEAQSNAVLRQLEGESVNGTPWHALSVEEQTKKFKERLTDFCKKMYQKTKVTQEEERTSIICMKANSFYVDTVRSFRDRRYEYKNLLKVWNKKRDQSKTPAEREQAKKMVVLYDSLQLAHKALLNSFYGYVMRTGSRWRSIEMAGIITHTGATIIKQTRYIVQGLGKGLELDTDGIWSAFPSMFPMTKTFQLKNGQRASFSFPCSMLNHNVDKGFSNYQYHELIPGTNEYIVRKENSIFFEIDGPYHAMFLPAAKEENKKLKKRYAVFNSHGHITELKGFEIKRRGEWIMIKMLQNDAFISFMKGNTNQEIYQNVAEVCKQYLMILRTKGRTIEDDELLGLLSESSTMSKNLVAYGNRKSTSITTARRLAEILGDDILTNTGLKCEYIISRLPTTESVALRAIPVIIFRDNSQERILFFLRKWTNDSTLQTTDFRDIIDWDYYTNRLYSALQKILIIPSMLQGITIKNFDVPPPDWVIKRQKEQKLMKGQTKLNFEAATERPKIIRQKAIRDYDKLTDYQKKLLMIKKNWRLNRSIAIENRVSTTSFNEWRVIEIRPSSQPGTIIAFIQVAPKVINRIEIDVPRIFYINSTSEAAEIFQQHMKDKAKQVKINLPHSFPPDVVTKFTIAGVYGVYETNVPPIFRALCNLGLSINPYKKNKWILPNIKQSKTLQLPIFDGINKIFIYSCYSKRKGMIAMVPILLDSEVTDATIFMFYPDPNDLSTPPLKNIQEAALQRITNDIPIVKIGNYNIKHVQTVRESAQLLQNTLSKFGRNNNTVIILNSHLTLDQLLTSLKVTTLHNYPIITLDFPESDDFYNESNQRWDITVFENFITRYLQFQIDLSQRLNYAQLLNIPIGNLNEDICMKALDILFARELIQNNYALWYSESSEPDIGGSYSNTLISTPGDPFSSLCENKKGTYMSRCIEYRVSHLSTSAIIECQTLIDQYLPQHITPSFEDFNSKPSLDAITITAPVFNILSNFLSKIVTKCQNESNILSSLIGHIGTWLGSSSSVFYDPALHSVFYHFLTILFKQMISHFNSSDIPVIFADQSRLILNIGDFSPDHAFIELKNKQLLRWIDFEVIHDYTKLVWIDEFNYQGTFDTERYLSTWNISKFLPEKYSDYLIEFFNDLMLFEVHQLKDFFKSASMALFKMADSARLTPTIIDNKLRKKTSLQVNDFLLLINTIFYVIDGLGDEKIQHQIQSLRRNILTILNIGEFDQRAKFDDPSLSLTIPNVLCHHCLSVRNIDVLRDEDILEGNWLCIFCQQPYDVRIFERWIFEEFSRRYQFYMTQDLRCEKCKKVQGRKLMLTCEDGGKLKTSVAKDEMLEFMKTVAITAKYHEFKNLLEVIEKFIQLSE